MKTTGPHSEKTVLDFGTRSKPSVKTVFLSGNDSPDLWRPKNRGDLINCYSLSINISVLSCVEVLRQQLY